MKWEITYYNAALQQEIMSLPVGMQARYIHLTIRMLEYGPNLGMPHTRAMGDGLFELRLKSKEGIGRIFYGIMIEETIVMLHSFVKKTQKTPANELNKARQRLKEVKNVNP